MYVMHNMCVTSVTPVMSVASVICMYVYTVRTYLRVCSYLVGAMT